MKFAKGFSCLLFSAAFLIAWTDAYAQFGGLTSKLKSSAKDSVSAENIPNPAADKAFNKHKENIVKCYEFLNTFTSSNNSNEVAEMCGSVNDVIALSETVVKEINDSIPDLAAYQKTNSEAKEMLLKQKIGYIETLIDKAKDTLGGIKKSTLKKIKRDVEWLASPEANVQYASGAMDSILRDFDSLDKLFKNDAEIAAAKKTDLPLAKKNYDTLLKQVEKMRMPASKYKGGDRADVEKACAAAYIDRYSGSAVKRVVIKDASWKTQTTLEDNNRKVYWQTADYISADVAVAKGNVCTVYAVTFKKPKGGKLVLGSIGANYPVTLANVNK